jgi:peptide/nickel transport system substrate-binding protein
MLGQWQGYPDKWDIVPIFFNGDFPSPGQMNVLASAASPASETHPEIADDRSQDLIDALADYNDVDNADDAHKVMDTITGIVARDKPAIILGMTKPYAAYSPTLKGYDNYWYVFWNSWIAE